MSNIANLLKDLGQRLASYRISRHLKQTELAAAAGVDRTTISRLEKGTATIDTLARVLVALEIEDRLLNIVPDASLDPLDPLQAKGHRRQRVRDKNSPNEDGQWSWGDET